ncbi:MAG: hypothetical protein CL780_03985 [Chloroflexi bacterium]|nr:hypothetical protein [Chloroflexota bacterium]|tara:strand:- start:125 stop:1252 length:1128 start_codon:yes stop_codon:yes gene_type:complete
MESVYKAAKKELNSEKQMVITTVVKTSGSTPQKSGARLLVKSDGSAIGTLGGGCVEGDIWFASSEILKQGLPAEMRSYELNEDLAAKDGLVCGGTMYFLIDPIREKTSNAETIIGEIIQAYDGGKPVALAQLIKSNKKYDKIGESLLIRENGSIIGSLGSNSLNSDAISKSRNLLALGKNEYVKKDGREYYIEAYTTQPNLVLAGGGHISNAIAPIAKTLGFKVFVIDDRQEFSNSERFPDADKTLVADYPEGIKKLVPNANTFVVVATRGHRHDDDAIAAALETDASYIGLVGSKRKAILIFEQLISKGFTEKQIKEIRSPIGINIGARTPEEIAISIVSEILSFRLGGTESSMKLEEKILHKAMNKGKLSRIK